MVGEYIALRKAGGLSLRDFESAQIGLENSYCSVTIRKIEDNCLIGMGRVMGDGGASYQIVDIVVHPNEQGKGFGSKIMEVLMKCVDEFVNLFAYVGLVADTPADKLYEKFGFTRIHSNYIGMHYKRSKS